MIAPYTVRYNSYSFIFLFLFLPVVVVVVVIISMKLKNGLKLIPQPKNYLPNTATLGMNCWRPGSALQLLLTPAEGSL